MDGALPSVAAGLVAVPVIAVPTSVGYGASFGGIAGGQTSFVAAGFVVAGVVGGSTAWWLALTTLIGLFHARIDDRIVRIINRCSGVAVSLFGMVVLIHVLHKLW